MKLDKRRKNMNYEKLKQDLVYNKLEDGKESIEEIAKSVGWDVETVKKMRELYYMNQGKEKSHQEITTQVPKKR